MCIRDSYMRVLKQVVEELPRAHAVRALEPQVRAGLAARIPDAERIERLREYLGVLLVVAEGCLLYTSRCV